MAEIQTIKEVAELVRQTRKAQKISQTVLSQASNVGLRFVGDIERGKPTIQFDKLMKVLSSLGIAVTMKAP